MFLEGYLKLKCSESRQAVSRLISIILNQQNVLRCIYNIFQNSSWEAAADAEMLQSITVCRFVCVPPVVSLGSLTL